MVQTPQFRETAFFSQFLFNYNFFRYAISLFFYKLLLNTRITVCVQKALHVNILLLSKYTSYSSELWTNNCHINMTPRLYKTWNIKDLCKNKLEMTWIISDVYGCASAGSPIIFTKQIRVRFCALWMFTIIRHDSQEYLVFSLFCARQ